MQGAGVGLALLALAVGCGSEQRAEPPVAETEAPAAPEPQIEAEAEVAPSCEDRFAEVTALIGAAVESNATCTYDVECVAARGGGECMSGCDVAVHPRGIDALRDVERRIREELCPPFAEAGCTPVHVECARSTPRCESGRCEMRDGDAPLREMPVPPENEARRDDDPPARPPGGGTEEELARRLFAAIVHDEPERASDFFFPREAFAEVKAIADPDGYWKRLYARYARDIHDLHTELGALTGAEYQRLEIVRRGGWVRIGEEGNALPYWVARHNLLHYRVGGEERALEVRVMITWGERWYVTHLKEFH